MHISVKKALANVSVASILTFIFMLGHNYVFSCVLAQHESLCEERLYSPTSTILTLQAESNEAGKGVKASTRAPMFKSNRCVWKDFGHLLPFVNPS